MKRYKIIFNKQSPRLNLGFIEESLQKIAERCRVTPALTVVTATGSSNAYVTFFVNRNLYPNYSFPEADYDIDLSMTMISMLIEELGMYWDKSWSIY